MGDRSHPQLQVLDDLRLTYNGWEADVCKAEDLHLNYPTRFDWYVAIIQKKQALYVGDRSHPQLQALDNLAALGTITYDGWQGDMRQAEELHLNQPSLFDYYVDGMQLKQAVYVGDRSHPYLQALDNLKRAGLTYIGWEADVLKAEDYHASHVSYPSLFDSYVEEMRRKQALYVGDRSHPQLQALDSMKREGLTYVGWQGDALKAEDYHVKYPIIFSGYVESMRKKQAFYVGDRSHPQLQALDSMKREGLTYVGWQGDVLKAEDYHVNYPIHFDKCLQEMRSKQTSYSSRQNARRLAAHESHHPRLPRESDRRIDDRQNLMAESQEKEDCVICWSSKKTHAFISCGHMCVCDGCADTIRRGNSKCPLCRMVSRQIKKIYL